MGSGYPHRDSRLPDGPRGGRPGNVVAQRAPVGGGAAGRAETCRAAARVAGGASVDATLVEARSAIVPVGYARIEYLELRAKEDLATMQALDRPGRLLVAAWLGETRLIDNVEVPSRPGAITRTAA
ncbi:MULTISPECIES: pantoate--beta-alanine ligase [Mesorhizobium]|uniref:pantoate--beta-alanine ligase n=1 Tax=Mesorhizobium TaxID=68287 RepID=UPI002E3224E8|nr:pantoate--beta-alanine ligase [Mesorhizobium muleiense]